MPQECETLSSGEREGLVNVTLWLECTYLEKLPRLQHHYVHWVVRISLDLLYIIDSSIPRVISNCTGCLGPICYQQSQSDAVPHGGTGQWTNSIGDLCLTLPRILQLASFGFACLFQTGDWPNAERGGFIPQAGEVDGTDSLVARSPDDIRACSISIMLEW